MILRLSYSSCDFVHFQRETCVVVIHLLFEPQALCDIAKRMLVYASIVLCVRQNHSSLAKLQKNGEGYKRSYRK